MSNEQVIRDFYSAFARRDASGMEACYHPELVFSDPVFGDLSRDRAVAMWKMLCERGKDLEIEVSGVWAEIDRGGAHWDASYTFAASGRRVVNRIDAGFIFDAGKIVRHVDSFDLRKWAGQALGLPGRLLGGTPFFKRKIRAQALKALDSYMAKRG